jgi:catechol 2,3-dioxygenase-like lactoylglutathione lyase family enzyme
MLGTSEIAAIVPVSDVEKAVDFYGGTLGLELQIRRDDLPENREAEFRAGDGSLVVYESVAAGQSRGTVAGFRVEDLDSVVAGLRERGVVFEEYDLPDLKTENGIASTFARRGRATPTATSSPSSSGPSSGSRRQRGSGRRCWLRRGGWCRGRRRYWSAG